MEEYREIEELLKKPLPINSWRKGVGVGRTQVFGFCRRMSYYPWYVRNNKRYPELYKSLCELGKRICPFAFDAIQVNQNMECKAHVDKGNLGLSVIVSGGDYTGGELVVEGEVKETRYKPLVFDGGKNRHWNNPITSGNKWSIVYFKISVPEIFRSKYPEDVNNVERTYSLIDYYETHPEPVIENKYRVRPKKST